VNLQNFKTILIHQKPAVLKFIRQKQKRRKVMIGNRKFKKLSLKLIVKLKIVKKNKIKILMIIKSQKGKKLLLKKVQMKFVIL